MRKAAVLALFAIVLAPAAPAGSAAGNAVTHHPTSTKSPAAQACFDRGLTLFYAYNRLASQRAFECAAKADPTFAMAYWGIALAQGTNINVEVAPAGEKAAFRAIRRAAALQGRASEVERAYIAALSTRYSNRPKPDLRSLAVAYAAAMRMLANRYPDDLDASIIAAESAMELRPWQWYTTDGDPVAGTNDILATLSRVLERDPTHIGANHFFIHMTEASRHPERALPHAARLRTMQFEPGAAHLVHMPAHVYMRTGDFTAAAEVNEHASMHDLAYRHDAHEADPEASIYHDHNLTMLAAAYGNAGRWSAAKRTAATLTADGALVPALFVYLRFNRWNDIFAIKSPRPDPNEPIRVGMWHFARGMALAATRRLGEARLELAAVRAAATTLNVPAAPGSYNSAANIFRLASDVLAAKLAGAENRRASQIALLRHAVAVQDRLLYIEPPDWYAPVRESLGATLFAGGDYAAATNIFRDDLIRNPRNARSLFGLAESLRKQGREAEAVQARTEFDAAWQRADAPLAMSRL
jgi:tetratricopeptide (TPR) repeat protein